jgi:hypothetical protein
MEAPQMRKTEWGWEVTYPDRRAQSFSDKRSAKSAIKRWRSDKIAADLSVER